MTPSLLESLFCVPSSILPESYYRFLALFTPSVSLLGFVRPPFCPSWDEGVFRILQLHFDDPERSRSLYDGYRGYQQFAEMHGERHLAESMALLQSEEERDESRLSLRAMLRDPTITQRDVGWEMAAQAALFLEIARDLDTKELELQRDLSTVSALETQFRELLGVTTEEEWKETEEVVRITAESLPRLNYGGYLIKQRLISWLRVYFSRLPFRTSRKHTEMGEILHLRHTIPLLLCISSDVREELVDPVRTREERAGRRFTPQELELITLPNCFEEISNERYCELRTSLTTHLLPFWDALQAYIGEPERGETLRTLEGSARSLQQAALAHLGTLSSLTTLSLSLTYHPLLHITTIWQYLDPSGYRTITSGRTIASQALPILTLSETLGEEASS